MGFGQTTASDGQNQTTEADQTQGKDPTIPMDANTSMDANTPKEADSPNEKGSTEPLSCVKLETDGEAKTATKPANGSDDEWTLLMEAARENSPPSAPAEKSVPTHPGRLRLWYSSGAPL